MTYLGLSGHSQCLSSNNCVHIMLNGMINWKEIHWYIGSDLLMNFYPAYKFQDVYSRTPVHYCIHGFTQDYHTEKVLSIIDEPIEYYSSCQIQVFVYLQQYIGLDDFFALQ